MSHPTDTDKIIFHVVFRSPKYPVIINSSDRLRAAKSLQGLAKACLLSSIHENNHHIIIINVTGDEFWYVPDFYAVSPGFIHKRWTKKRMIDLYNQSVNARETGVTYSDRSLGNKTLARVTADLCALIERSAGR